MGSLACLSRAGRRLGRAHGFATMGFVLAVGFSMLFFVLLANLLAVQYGRGVVRAALDEGARHGARYGAGAAECETRIQTVLAGLLAGEMGSGVSYQCVSEGAETKALAQVHFPGWLPGVPDFRFEMAASAATERQ